MPTPALLGFLEPQAGSCCPRKSHPSGRLHTVPQVSPCNNNVVERPHDHQNCLGRAVEMSEAERLPTPALLGLLEAQAGSCPSRKTRSSGGLQLIPWAPSLMPCRISFFVSVLLRELLGFSVPVQAARHVSMLSMAAAREGHLASPLRLQLQWQDTRLKLDILRIVMASYSSY